ncbi:MAG TPA: aldehyde oxidase [Aciduliprofundum sp.]|nr:aldehyde oxidase [Aciduliprofundum sp.]
MLEEARVVGSRYRRKDALAKVRGAPIFTDDVEIPDALWVAVVRSERPHARILSVDTSAAEEVPGFVGLVTYEDVPGENVLPVIKDDMPVLSEGIVRYVGEPILLVVAESRKAAYEAASRVRVEYEDLPAVFDPVEAMREGAPLVAREGFSEEGNIFVHLWAGKGEPDELFGECAVVHEAEYRTPMQEHLYLETQSAIAVPTPDGGVEVMGSIQCPSQDYVQGMLSRVLGLPLSKVRVKALPLGGGFGGKEEVPGLVAAHAALAALKFGRPARISLEREEDFISTSKRHQAIMRVKVGADAEGRLLALKAQIILDAGAYQTLSPAVLWRAMIHIFGPYRYRAAWVDAYAVATNKVPAGAFRGFGAPEGAFAIEMALNELARKLGMDPLELRKKNTVIVGDELGFGQRLTFSVGARDTVLEAERISNYRELRSMRGGGRLKVGIGVATAMMGNGLGGKAVPLEKATAVVRMFMDGSVEVLVGTTEMGQGSWSGFAAIASEILGVPYEWVTVAGADTAMGIDSGPTVASRSTVFQGRAVQMAAEKLRRRLVELASELLGTRPDDVELSGGYAFSREDPDLRIGIRELASKAWERNLNLQATGYASMPDFVFWDYERGTGNAYPQYSYATHITVVEVDPETGEVRVREVYAAYDAGRIINREAAEGQVIGGTVMSIGYALTEDLKLEEGRILNPNFTDYLIPTVLDAPERTVVSFVEDHPSPIGGMGAKALGELPMVVAPASIAAAVADALGVPVRELPLTPEAVWRLMSKGKESSNEE